MNKSEKTLILAMAYPELSRKYKEAVCMAGITEDGDLRRIYPIPFTKFLTFGFHKRQYIEYALREKGDFRKESYKIHHESITKGDKIEYDEVRKIWKPHIHTLEELKELWSYDRTSLGFIKPKLDGIKIIPKSPDELKKAHSQQLNLDGTINKFEILPFDLKYKFRCSDSCTMEKGHNCLCLDTEIGQLYRNLENRHGVGNPDILPKLEDKFYSWMKNRDIFFMMGNHSHHPTAWMSIAIHYPAVLPVHKQSTLF